MNNLPTLNAGQVIETLTTLYSTVELSKVPSVMLWGPPGIGKSDSCRQIANNIGEMTGKTSTITDVRLLLFQSIDLRGIPVPDVNKEFAIWLKPKIFNMDDSDNVINFLILDEISAAPPSVQAAAYQLTLDRKIGEHSLPNNCIIIAAGNRVTDKSVAYKMPKALANRLLHIEMTSSIGDWKKWAIPHGVDERIISYMNYKKNDDILFSFNSRNDELAFSTPRSWAKVSDIIQNISSVQTIYPLIAGMIGVGPATDFIAYCRLFEELPDINKIFSGEYKDVPTKTDIVYALSGALINNAAKETETDRINNMMNYLDRMPREIAFLVVSDCFLNKDLRLKIIKTEAWSKKFLKEWGKMLLGN